VLSLLCTGTALHGVMFFPYALQIASGLPRLALQINWSLLCVLVPLTIFLASRYGAIGGALAWLLLHITYVLLGTWLTHRRLLVGVGARWILRDVAVPFGISAAIILAARYFIARAELAAGAALVLAACTAIIGVVICLATYPEARKFAANELHVRNLAARLNSVWRTRS
jgi:O-antigen/teichoic acid export membrane protein